MRRRIITIGMLLCILFLSACEKEEQKEMEENKIVKAETTAEVTAVMEAATEEDSVSDGKSLIVYFSQSGNTERIAYDIQELTGANIFEITTVEGYPENLNELYNRGQAELDANVRPELEIAVDNFEVYDTVFLGYPIWGGTCPMAVFSFLEQYDFSKKTVIPFCTHGGSGFSRSISDMEKALPGDITVLEGLSVYGPEAENAKSDVEQWLDEIYLTSRGNGTVAYSYNIQKISCKVEGQNIYGVAYIPEIQEKVPLVIFAHELCCTHESGTAYAEELASRGVAVYTFDFRGGSEESRSDGNTVGMSVMTEAEDLAAVIQEAVKWDFVDANRIVLMGASQGGMASVIASARNQEKISGLILLYPALLVRDEIQEEFGELEDVPEKFYWKQWILVGKNYASDVWDYDVYEDMKVFDKPVMILHGDQDAVVDVSYSERAVKNYPDAELHIISGGDHVFSGNSFDKAVDYIVDYLQGLRFFE